MRIVMTDLCYPYGKQRVYLNGSLMTAAARLVALGHHVDIVDLNINSETDVEVQTIFERAAVLGISVYGSPFIPSAIAFAERHADLNIPVWIGGQAVEHLTPHQFEKLFGHTNAVQIASDEDLAQALHCAREELPDPNDLSIALALQHAPEHYLARYFSSEMALVLGQGCVYQCVFCAARKDQRETRTTLHAFEQGLTWMCEKARSCNQRTLQFYASSLDFFQNPLSIAEYLRVIAKISRQTGVHVRLRALCCMKSFLRAHHSINNFDTLVRDAGLWSLGFGVDGADDAVWKAQHKMHNDAHEVLECLNICTQLEIRPEVLLVMGFPEDTVQSMLKNFVSAARYVHRWPTVMLRPYLAKSFIPGNDGWKQHQDRVSIVLDDPQKFYNLDFSALASPITHPDRTHRYISNLAYLGIIAVFTPFGHCNTPPILPQGEKGWYGRIARVLNSIPPADL